MLRLAEGRTPKRKQLALAHVAVVREKNALHSEGLLCARAPFLVTAA